MTYFVIAKKWDDKTKSIKPYIVGQSEHFLNASLLSKAYNEYYHSDSKVIEERKLLENLNK